MVNSISHLHLNTIHLKMNFDENILTAFPMENTATHLIADSKNLPINQRFTGT